MTTKTTESRARIPRRSGHPGLETRRVAAEAVRRARRERRVLDEALILAGGARLTEPDAALARAIATVAFRRFGTIDAVLAARLKDGKLPEAGLLDEIMRVAVAQILFMDAPDHAAVDLAVESAKADRLALHYAPLVNAVLRRIAAEKAEILTDASEALDTPQWLFARWADRYGPEAAHAIARMHRHPPNIDLTVFGDPAAFAQEIEGVLLPTGSVRLRSDARIIDLPGYAEGRFQVQDAASALPARLLGARPGLHILDLCAAPGGKTAQLAAAGAEIVAVERSAQRAERLAENLARLRLRAEIVIGDAGQYQSAPFDAVLLDAPCSATGTIRRHPEIAWTKRLEDVLALARQQAPLLAHAGSLVKPGGILVYSTCSLEHEEGERQVERFLNSQSDFALIPILPEELGIESASITASGMLRMLPSHLGQAGGVDGFFAARLRRRM